MSDNKGGESPPFTYLLEFDELDDDDELEDEDELDELELLIN